MSANADVLGRHGLMGAPARETASPRVEVFCETNQWHPEEYAREQIRSLVRRVFFGGGAGPVRQVVFSAAEPQIDVAKLCDQVGRALALETRASVAIVDREPRVAQMLREYPRYSGSAAIKARSTQVAANLWWVPDFGAGECGAESGTGRHWLACLTELRNEFEYAVIHGPAAGTSSEAALLGHLADGIILVLGAHSTRKATARKIKEALEGAQARILGTVLSERTFPVPERIYRRL